MNRKDATAASKAKASAAPGPSEQSDDQKTTGSREKAYLGENSAREIKIADESEVQGALEGMNTMQ